MSERMSIGYKRLFEVRLLHHYWLDHGATPFDQMAELRRTKRLLTYDRRPFLTVRPSGSTKQALSGSGLIYKDTALGFLVAAPDTARLAANTKFTFIIKPASAEFSGYTALTLRKQERIEVIGATMSFKSNVPVLSNLTGATRNLNGNTVLFLSRQLPTVDPSDAVESLVDDGGALRQLTADNPGATSQKLADDINLAPVYLHQADAPLIVPPAGVTGLPSRGIELTDDIPADVYTLVSLTARRPGNDAFSFIDNAGAPKLTAPVFEVRFKNRSTVWTYRDKATGAVTDTETNALPFTWHGNAGTKVKPWPAHVKAERTGNRITRIISEIFV